MRIGGMRREGDKKHFIIVTQNPLSQNHYIIKIYKEVEKMNIMEKFGLAIKNLRQKKALSQEKFALTINMDRTYLASVESGKRNISLLNIEKIANGLDISLADLFKLAGK